MSPNIFGNSATLFLEASQQNVPQDKSLAGSTKTSQAKTGKPKNTSKYEWQIVWRNVIAFVYLHVSSLYALYLAWYEMKLFTCLWTIGLALFAALGITAGAHRLWCHRSYKAKWPLRLILMILQTVAFQNHIYEWVRDHRVHHKFCDTDADPHNSKRGFFFSHMGWLMLRKHPDVLSKGKLVDMSDLEKDPIVVWQRRLYVVLMPIFCFLIPTWVPIYFWNETPMLAWYATVFRYTVSLNLTWLVNSAAHIYGMKPYDNSISPTDHFMVAVGAMGEGWHNYHHVFPWDYKAAELGNYRTNLSTAFIDFFSSIGWAYDLKTVPVEMIEKRAARTGDGTRVKKVEGHHHHEHSHEGAIWGWGDSDMSIEDIKEAHIINKSD
ncbi:acyl-CoA Delta-9 desaturase-like [Venturia canescens]|uniref:acyl-CoA Delta-9 desaturase-like n=1 Tax=Venturia canescens TaxID=32260 RepID=UPI001C9CD40C|nr:acyl-CoA Delta-9 desaturase-like [Venturia canescens]XP_043274168.1 acyl-CoA Delta-9 desaturase-like [Venturia canescens]